MTLDDARNAIGRKVIYQATLGRYKAKPEEGVITSVNDTYVFVRYGRDAHARATRPQDIDLVSLPTFGGPHG